MQSFAPQYRLRFNVETKDFPLADDLRTRIQPDLERVAQAVEEFPSADLWLTIVYHPRSNAYHAQAKLKLPGETIITGYRHESPLPAIERCLDRVVRRVEVYRRNPDDEALRRAAGAADLLKDVIAPTEPDSGEAGRAVQAGDYAAFRHALLAYDEWMRLRMGRWVQRYPEVQAEIGSSFEIADLVEEVFLIAFERYAGRPTDVPLHEWLDGLLDDAVKEFQRSPEDQEAVSYARSFREPSVGRGESE